MQKTNHCMSVFDVLMYDHAQLNESIHFVQKKREKHHLTVLTHN